MRRWKNCHHHSTQPLPVMMIFMASLVFSGCGKDKYPEHGDPTLFTYLAVDNPPLSYLKDGQLTGAAVDLLDTLFLRMEVSVDRSNISMISREDADSRVLSTPNTMMLTSARNSSNTGLYKWVGPIANNTEIAISLSKTGYSVKQVTDINNYFIGAVNGSPSVDVLLDHGIYRANIILYETVGELYKAMVTDQEVQFIANSLAGHKQIIKDLGYASTDFGVPFPVFSYDVFYAFNDETADELVVWFQEKLDMLKEEHFEDGTTTWSRILSRYDLP